MDAVVEGDSPDIDPDLDLAFSDFALTDAATTAHDQRDRRPRRSRKGGSAIGRGLRRMWIPLVILVVLAVGGFTVSRLHGIFGSEKSLSYGDTKIKEDAKPFNPKILRYEIFGPPGTVADISYFDGNGEPQAVKAVLPWSQEYPLTAAAGVGSIAAQGDSSSLGCRILVDGEVKEEKIATHEVSTFTSCLLKAA